MDNIMHIFGTCFETYYSHSVNKEGSKRVAVTWSGPASDTPSLLTAGQYVTLTPV
jgi:hypothetical protein